MQKEPKKEQFGNLEFGSSRDAAVVTLTDIAIHCYKFNLLCLSGERAGIASLCYSGPQRLSVPELEQGSFNGLTISQKNADIAYTNPSNLRTRKQIQNRRLCPREGKPENIREGAYPFTSFSVVKLLENQAASCCL